MNSELVHTYLQNDGLIFIDTILGGGGSFEYSLDGQFYQMVNSFPIVIPAVESGNYEIYFQDINDCSNSSIINVESPLQPALELGDDIPITLGDSVELEALTNILVDQYNWNTTLFMSCDTCLNTFTTPMETISYTLEVRDSLGCFASDDITISVSKPRDVYIPNAFSPNGDGINDVFFINATQEVLRIKTMRIFDRWGENVFSLDDFQPNNPILGWNGDFKSERLNPGVFIYIVEIEFIDGHVEFYQGDVTLMK